MKINTIKIINKNVSYVLLVAFLTVSIIPPGYAQAQPLAPLTLPIPGTLVGTSPAFVPANLIGLKIDPVNPLNFNFLINTGDESLSSEQLTDASDALVRYFLASLAIPEEDMWVNLSPYEQDRIIEDNFAQTAMGRDLLAQDYILKQLTASLLYPEGDLGKAFWQRIRQEAEALGLKDIPTETFHKIWITPDSATVFEDGDTVYVAEARLKVLLEIDYLAQIREQGTENREQKALGFQATSNQQQATYDVLRDVILPAIETEVNHGESFARLRQIYHAMVLATWFKQSLKQSLIGQIYADQSRVQGIAIDDPDADIKIYNQYIESIKQGAFNFIKEEYDPVTQTVASQKYFSGGFAPDASVLQTIDAADLMVASVNTQRTIRDFVAFYDAAVSDAAVFDVRVALGESAQDAAGLNRVSFSEQFTVNNMSIDELIARYFQGADPAVEMRIRSAYQVDLDEDALPDVYRDKNLTRLYSLTSDFSQFLKMAKSSSSDISNEKIQNEIRVLAAINYLLPDGSFPKLENWGITADGFFWYRASGIANGRSLDSIVNAKEDIGEILGRMSQYFEAILMLNRVGYYHGDPNLENSVFDAQGNIMVIDFGEVKKVDDLKMAEYPGDGWYLGHMLESILYQAVLSESLLQDLFELAREMTEERLPLEQAEIRLDQIIERVEEGDASGLNRLEGVNLDVPSRPNRVVFSSRKTKDYLMMLYELEFFKIANLSAYLIVPSVGRLTLDDWINIQSNSDPDIVFESVMQSLESTFERNDRFVIETEGFIKYLPEENLKRIAPYAYEAINSMARLTDRESASASGFHSVPVGSQKNIFLFHTSLDESWPAVKVKRIANDQWEVDVPITPDFYVERELTSETEIEINLGETQKEDGLKDPRVLIELNAKGVRAHYRSADDVDDEWNYFIMDQQLIDFEQEADAAGLDRAAVSVPRTADDGIQGLGVSDQDEQDASILSGESIIEQRIASGSIGRRSAEPFDPKPAVFEKEITEDGIKSFTAREVYDALKIKFSEFQDLFDAKIWAEAKNQLTGQKEAVAFTWKHVVGHDIKSPMGPVYSVLEMYYSFGKVFNSEEFKENIIKSIDDILTSLARFDFSGKEAMIGKFLDSQKGLQNSGLDEKNPVQYSSLYLRFLYHAFREHPDAAENLQKTIQLVSDLKIILKEVERRVGVGLDVAEQAVSENVSPTNETDLDVADPVSGQAVSDAASLQEHRSLLREKFKRTESFDAFKVDAYALLSETGFLIQTRLTENSQGDDEFLQFLYRHYVKLKALIEEYFNDHQDVVNVFGEVGFNTVSDVAGVEMFNDLREGFSYYEKQVKALLEDYSDDDAMRAANLQYQNYKKKLKDMISVELTVAEGREFLLRSAADNRENVGVFLNEVNRMLRDKHVGVALFLEGGNVDTLKVNITSAFMELDAFIDQYFPDSADTVKDMFNRKGRATAGELLQYELYAKARDAFGVFVQYVDALSLLVRVSDEKQMQIERNNIIAEKQLRKFKRDVVIQKNLRGGESAGVDTDETDRSSLFDQYYSPLSSFKQPEMKKLISDTKEAWNELHVVTSKHFYEYDGYFKERDIESVRTLFELRKVINGGIDLVQKISSEYIRYFSMHPDAWAEMAEVLSKLALIRKQLTELTDRLHLHKADKVAHISGRNFERLYWRLLSSNEFKDLSLAHVALGSILAFARDGEAPSALAGMMQLNQGYASNPQIDQQGLEKIIAQLKDSEINTHNHKVFRIINRIDSVASRINAAKLFNMWETLEEIPAGTTHRVRLTEYQGAMNVYVFYRDEVTPAGNLDFAFKNIGGNLLYKLLGVEGGGGKFARLEDEHMYPFQKGNDRVVEISSDKGEFVLRSFDKPLMFFMLPATQVDAAGLSNSRFQVISAWGSGDRAQWVKNGIRDMLQEGLSYEEAELWRNWKINNMDQQFPRNFWMAEETITNMILVTLDAVPGFKEARESNNIARMRDIYRSQIRNYKGEKNSSQFGFFKEKGGLGGLLTNAHGHFKKSASAAELVRWTIPELIDIRNPDALDPREIETSYYMDPENAKFHILLALDTVEGFKEARESGDIKKMAELYRKHVIGYQAKESHHHNGQVSFFLEVGKLSGLLQNTGGFLSKKGSPAELLRLALPGLIDVQNPDALDPLEVESHYWKNEANVKYHTLKALDSIKGFSEARQSNDIKAMARLYRENVYGYRGRPNRVPGQWAFFEDHGMGRVMAAPRNNQTIQYRPIDLLKLAVPGLVDENNPDALNPQEIRSRGRRGVDSKEKLASASKTDASRLNQFKQPSGFYRDLKSVSFTGWMIKDYYTILEALEFGRIAAVTNYLIAPYIDAVDIELWQQITDILGMRRLDRGIDEGLGALPDTDRVVISLDEKYRRLLESKGWDEIAGYGYEAINSLSVLKPFGDIEETDLYPMAVGETKNIVPFSESLDEPPYLIKTTRVSETRWNYAAVDLAGKVAFERSLANGERMLSDLDENDGSERQIDKIGVKFSDKGFIVYHDENDEDIGWRYFVLDERLLEFEMAEDEEEDDGADAAGLSGKGLGIREQGLESAQRGEGLKVEGENQGLGVREQGTESDRPAKIRDFGEVSPTSSKVGGWSVVSAQEGESNQSVVFNNQEQATGNKQPVTDVERDASQIIFNGSNLKEYIDDRFKGASDAVKEFLVESFVDEEPNLNLFDESLAYGRNRVGVHANIEFLKDQPNVYFKIAHPISGAINNDFYNEFENELLKNEINNIVRMNLEFESRGMPRFLNWGITHGGYLWFSADGIKDGISLQSYFIRNKNMQDFISLTHEAINVAKMLRDNGFYHGDLGLVNFIVNEHKEMMVIDFSESERVAERDEDSTHEKRLLDFINEHADEGAHFNSIEEYEADTFSGSIAGVLKELFPDKVKDIKLSSGRLTDLITDQIAGDLDAEESLEELEKIFMQMLGAEIMKRGTIDELGLSNQQQMQRIMDVETEARLIFDVKNPQRAVGELVYVAPKGDPKQGMHSRPLTSLINILSKFSPQYGTFEAYYFDEDGERGDIDLPLSIMEWEMAGIRSGQKVVFEFEGGANEIQEVFNRLTKLFHNWTKLNFDNGLRLDGVDVETQKERWVGRIESQVKLTEAQRKQIAEIIEESSFVKQYTFDSWTTSIDQSRSLVGQLSRMKQYDSINITFIGEKDEWLDVFKGLKGIFKDFDYVGEDGTADAATLALVKKYMPIAKNLFQAAVALGLVRGVYVYGKYYYKPDQSLFESRSGVSAYVLDVSDIPGFDQETVMRSIEDNIENIEAHKEEMLEALIWFVRNDPQQGVALTMKVANQYFLQRHIPLRLSWPEFSRYMTSEIVNNRDLQRYLIDRLNQYGDDAQTDENVVSFLRWFGEDISAVLKEVDIKNVVDHNEVLEMLVLSHQPSFWNYFFNTADPVTREIQRGLKERTVRLLEDMNDTFMGLEDEQMRYIRRKINRLTFVGNNLSAIANSDFVISSDIFSELEDDALAHEIGHNVLHAFGVNHYGMKARSTHEYFAYLTSSAVYGFFPFKRGRSEHVIGSGALMDIENMLQDKGVEVNYVDLWHASLRLIREGYSIHDREFIERIMRDEGFDDAIEVEYSEDGEVHYKWEGDAAGLDQGLGIRVQGTENREQRTADDDVRSTQYDVRTGDRLKVEGENDFSTLDSVYDENGRVIEARIKTLSLPEIWNVLKQDYDQFLTLFKGLSIWVKDFNDQTSEKPKVIEVSWSEWVAHDVKEMAATMYALFQIIQGEEVIAENIQNYKDVLNVLDRFSKLLLGKFDFSGKEDRIDRMVQSARLMKDKGRDQSNPANRSDLMNLFFYRVFEESPQAAENKQVLFRSISNLKTAVEEIRYRSEEYLREHGIDAAELQNVVEDMYFDDVDPEILSRIRDLYQGRKRIDSSLQQSDSGSRAHVYKLKNDFSEFMRVARSKNSRQTQIEKNRAMLDNLKYLIEINELTDSEFFPRVMGWGFTNRQEVWISYSGIKYGVDFSHAYLNQIGIKRAVEITDKWMEAVELLHQLGFTHNDNHYHNVIFNSDDQVMVIDFDRVKKERVTDNEIIDDVNRFWVYFNEWIDELEGAGIDEDELKTLIDDLKNTPMMMSELRKRFEAVTVNVRESDAAGLSKLDRELAGFYDESGHLIESRLKELSAEQIVHAFNTGYYTFMGLFDRLRFWVKDFNEETGEEIGVKRADGHDWIKHDLANTIIKAGAFFELGTMGETVAEAVNFYRMALRDVNTLSSVFISKFDFNGQEELLDRMLTKGDEIADKGLDQHNPALPSDLMVLFLYHVFKKSPEAAKNREISLTSISNMKIVGEEVRRRIEAYFKEHGIDASGLDRAAYRVQRTAGDDVRSTQNEGRVGDRLKVEGESDQSAVFSNQEQSTSSQVGGIDLDSRHLNLQIKRNGDGVPLPVHMQDIQNINIDGLFPVIINISPVTSVPLIFSQILDDQDDTHQAAVSDFPQLSYAVKP